MGLIAREIEARGIPTLCLTSALSITRSVNPPRAAFVDYPLGHTAGKPHQPELQDAILEATLAAFETLDAPGEVASLRFHWSDDDVWKDSVMRPGGGGSKASQRGQAGQAGMAGEAGEVRDDRSERSAEPQYQTEADRVAAEGPSTGRSTESGSAG